MRRIAVMGDRKKRGMLHVCRRTFVGILPEESMGENEKRCCRQAHEIWGRKKLPVGGFMEIRGILVFANIAMAVHSFCGRMDLSF